MGLFYVERMVLIPTISLQNIGFPAENLHCSQVASNETHFNQSSTEFLCGFSVQSNLSLFDLLVIIHFNKLLISQSIINISFSI